MDGVEILSRSSPTISASAALPIAVVMLHPWTPALGAAVAVLAGATAVAPSLAALMIAPAQAMRGQVPVLAGRRSLVERPP